MIRFEMPMEVVAGCPMCSPDREATPTRNRLLCSTVVAAVGAAADSSDDGGVESAAMLTYDPAWAKLGNDWEMREADYRIQAELADWLPARIFDAHLHLWNFDYWNQPEAPTYGFLGHDGTLAAYKQRVEALFGVREVSGLMLPFPISGLESETAMSTWAAEQCRSNSGAGLFAPSMLITPATTYEEIVDGVKRFGFVNLKPYHTFSIGENCVPSTGEPSDNTACE